MNKSISIVKLIRDFREHPETLDEDERDIVVIALEAVSDMLRHGQTAQWETVHVPAGYFTPGGNSPHKCSACGYDIGANEIFPSAKICPGCRALMINGRRIH